MAERDALRKRYAYQEMSNKVEQADRSHLYPRMNEPTGEVESLRGRSGIGRMGDKIAFSDTSSTKKKQSRPAEVVEKLQRAAKKRKKRTEPADGGGGPTATGSSLIHSSGGQTILDMGHLTGYQPSHPDARLAYENLLTILSSKRYLGAQEPSIIRDAADEVLSILKSKYLKDPERQAQISTLVTGSDGGVSGEVLSQLVALGKRMDDYDVKDAEAEEEGRGQKVDDEMGVAVVFEEDDEDGAGDDSDDDGDEVVDVVESSDDDDDDANVVGADDSDGNNDDTNDDAGMEEKIILDDGKKSTDLDKLSTHEIDAHWLQRQLSPYFSDVDQSSKISHDVLDILHPSHDLRECENKLLSLLGFELFSLIKILLKHRVRIWACVNLKRTSVDDVKKKGDIESIVKATEEGRVVWDEIHSRGMVEDWERERMEGMKLRTRAETDKIIGVTGATGDEEKGKANDVIPTTTSSTDVEMKDVTAENNDNNKDNNNNTPTELDLESLVFREGSHVMSSTSKTCTLPAKSFRAMRKGYEEVHVPATKTTMKHNEVLIPIESLPSWTHAAFEGMDKLNRVQSKMCNVALKTGENLLLCAPTGAGKTNVAMLTILNILGQFREPNGHFRRDEFKIVYIAPMKALVQEVVKNLSHRLSAYKMTVRELSGDSSLTRQQIAETQVIVTTPEKWDVVTRQGEGRAYTQLVRLVIIDEIHLLADERGPVLETIVARVMRQVETTREPVRLVGLSATLPNYRDVATLLRVKDEVGLYFFDFSYRPVPLQMQYLGIAESNAFKRFQLMNELCYERALSQRKNSNQMLIFVHSRAETGKTAMALRDLALQRNEQNYFLKPQSASYEILKEEVSTVKHADLREVLSYGFAIHHAGMTRTDRELVEDLFADRHVGVLVCTATLAWGVNLPAHAVIIKGTQVYDPSKGRWTELSPLDVLQMLGRAGRPQYDTEGEGIIMTSHKELQYYLSLTNLQLPVESQFIKSLANHMNAEIVLGNVQSLEEAVDWLSYTFLYIRMLQNPSLYGIPNPEETLKTDPTLHRRRTDLAHTAATILEKSNLVRYDRRSGSLHSTPLGRIASQYYISHSSMSTYIRHLRPNLTDIELLRIFALSGEFTHITVREEEKLELAKLVTKVPIPVKESPAEPSAKINILLQAYVSRLTLEGFSSCSDMAFVHQSAGRIFRSLFEIALRRKWAKLARLALRFSNAVVRRVWMSQSPLRQISGVPEIVSRKLERKSDVEWSRYADLTPSDLGELVGVPKMGRTLHKLVHQFPKMELNASVQPLSRSLLRVELSLVPDFKYDVGIHGYVQLFHVWVEDVNGETILHHEMVALKSSQAEEEIVLLFTVPILDPLPPNYFLRVVSDRWLHCESVLPLSFQNMILPAKFPPPTELLDLQPLPLSALGEDGFIRLYEEDGIREFNPIQTQTFQELFKTNRNVLVASPTGSGKTVCAEFAIFKMLIDNPKGCCVYVAPKDDIVQRRYLDWKRRFGKLLFNNEDVVVRLSGEATDAASDVKALSSSSKVKIALATVEQWDKLSRRWRQRKAIREVALFVADEMHFLGGDGGPTYEVVLSRMRYISSQNKSSDNAKQMRIVGLSSSLANAKEVAEWMGVSSSKSLFNFSPKVRPIPLEIYFQSFDQANYASRLLAMSKPIYNAVMRHSEPKPSDEDSDKIINTKPVIIFVPSKRQAQLTAIDLLTYRESLENGNFLGPNATKENIQNVTIKIKDPTLQQVIPYGIGFLHQSLPPSDHSTILSLYHSSIIQILITPADTCYALSATAHTVVIMGTERYDGREKRHVDYPIADLLHMMGKASRPLQDASGKCLLFCHAAKKDHLKKWLYDPLPVESHLDHYLHDHFNSEIVTKTITSMQDAVDYVTWTLLYRRLTKNPNYYNLQGTSNVHLSEHLSEMVETVLGDLEESKCCKMTDDGDNVSPLNLGMIAAYYYVQYTTIELIASSVTAKTKTRGIMEILSASSEFGTLPVRQGEETQLKILARNLVHKLPDAAAAQCHDPNTKALILLQCHFSRKVLPGMDLRLDQKEVLGQSLNLIQAIVDVISSNGWLKPALAAMELSQMVVQGLWNKDHVLMQIPHFTKEIVDRCVAYVGKAAQPSEEGGDGGDGEEEEEEEQRIDSVFDILTLDDDVRNDLLRLPDDKMSDVAAFCNNYPNIDVTFKVIDEDEVTAGDPVQIVVTLEREIDDDDEEEDDEKQQDDELGIVMAPLYPKTKKEGWWIVVGDTKTNSLLSLKKVSSLEQKQKVTLEFIAPDEPGDYDMTLFCMSDAYLGCDQEFSVPLGIAAAVDDDDDDESDDEEEDDENDKMEDAGDS